MLGREVVGVRADLALLTHIREFQAEYETAGAPQVRVRLQARLIRLPRRTRSRRPRRSSSCAPRTIRYPRSSTPSTAFGKALKRIVEAVWQWQPHT